MTKPVIDTLPVSLAGRLLYRCLPYRRRVVMDNIDRVYQGTLSGCQKTHLAKAFYSHIALSLKEMLLLRFMREETIKARVEVRGHQHLLDIAAQGRGVLVLTGHFGNWEFAPIGGILNFTQFQGHFHFIRRTLGIQWLEQLLFKRYYRAGLQVIPKKNALQPVLEALDQNHAVVFVLDQHASLTNRDGIAVDFFGHKAGTYRSLATLARHTGIPVVPAAGYRLPNGQHVLEFHKPLAWEDKDSVSEGLLHNTRRYNEALERIILAHPEQWSWFHKRWKLGDTTK